MRVLSRAALIVFISLCSAKAEELPLLKGQPQDDSKYFHDEDNPHEFSPERSWYRGGHVHLIDASSELANSGSLTYKAGNAHDFDAVTAWVEGKPDDGIGEWIEYTFNFDVIPNYKGNLGIDKLLIANGYKKSLRLWKANNRIKKLRMSLDGKPIATIHLEDCFEIQTVAIPKIMFPPRMTRKLRFEILEVYRGEKYRDTALGLLMFDGVGVH